MIDYNKQHCNEYEHICNVSDLSDFRKPFNKMVYITGKMDAESGNYWTLIYISQPLRCEVPL